MSLFLHKLILSHFMYKNIKIQSPNECFTKYFIFFMSKHFRIKNEISHKLLIFLSLNMQNNSTFVCKIARRERIKLHLKILSFSIHKNIDDVKNMPCKITCHKKFITYSTFIF